VLFEIASLRPLELTVSFRQEMRLCGQRPVSVSPAPNGIVGEPITFCTPIIQIIPPRSPYRAHPGILPPYLERLQAYPFQFKLSFDPRTDSGSFIPLLIARTAPELTR
jgi:hypothetical protein